MTELDLSLNTRPKNSLRWLKTLLAVLSIVWLLTGLFVVRGNEVAVVRVFGRAVRSADSLLDVKPSGLYWNLPWPLATVDRVNVNEVRTLTVGGLESDAFSASDFLRTLDPGQQSQFLSGDKNVLHVTLNVQYRIDRTAVDQWLYASVATERRLHVLSGAVLADVVLRSGVDFVHTLGRNEIRNDVLQRLRVLTRRDALGVEIEDVTIASVAPPIRVKAEFVDVMNARADRETYINRARAYAEQRQADSTALASKTRDEAETFRRQNIERARAEAESFDKLIAQLQRDAARGSHSYAALRKLALQRSYLETIEGVLKRAMSKVVLHADQPVDLTIQPSRDPAPDAR